MLDGIKSVKAVSVPHDTHDLLCSGCLQCTHCPRENTEEPLELCVKLQHNWAVFQTTPPPTPPHPHTHTTIITTTTSRKRIWCMKSNDAVLAANFDQNVKSVLEFFESTCGTADFVVALSPPPLPPTATVLFFLAESLLLLWPNMSYRPVIGTQMAVSAFFYTKLLLLLWLRQNSCLLG